MGKCPGFSVVVWLAMCSFVFKVDSSAIKAQVRHLRYKQTNKQTQNSCLGLGCMETPTEEQRGKNKSLDKWRRIP